VCALRNVVVIGGGVVGTHAARVAAGMGANVTVLDAPCPACAIWTIYSAAVQDRQFSDKGAVPI
jgi:alanine dehydrogenase